MRILHLMSQTQLTGAEVFAFTLAESQQKSDLDQVFAISDQFHLPWSCPILKLPISIKRGFQRWTTLWKLRKFLIQHQIDIIHTHSRAAARQAFWSRWGLNIAVISSIHGRQHYSLSKKLWDIYGEQVLPVCENAGRSLIQDFGMNPDKIEIFRNPFQLPLKSDFASLEDICFLWVTRPTGPKGQRAFSFLSFCLQNSTLVLQLRQQCQEKILFQWIGLDPNDFPEELKKTWNQAPKEVQSCFQFEKHHVGLNPYYLRAKSVIGSGRVAMEAGLYGKNIIALGEHCFHGLVDTFLLSECWATNFGDMGYGKEENLKIPPETIFSCLSENILSFQSKERQKQTDEIQLLMQNELNVQLATDRLRRIYQRRLFQRYFPKWIPVLMYHKIPSFPLKSKHRIFVTKDRFEKHLQWFQSWGMQTITFSILMDFFQGRKSMKDFPRKPLILTFDDGYQDNLLHAGPLLKKYRMTAVIYLLANNEISSNQWDMYDPNEESSPLCSKEERQKLPSFFEIGSHCIHHKALSDQTDDEQLHQLSQSKIDLQNEFRLSIDSVAYPYGKRNMKTSSLAEKAGYHFGVNTDQGGRRWYDDPYSIFRVNIFPEETYFSMWKKTRPGYRDYFLKKRGR